MALLSIKAPKKTSSNKIAIGIDLGTTHCVAAVYQEGKPRCLSIDGHDLVPSALYIDKSGKRVVGSKALRLKAEYPHRVFTSTKRWLGKTVAELQSDGCDYPLEPIKENELPQFSLGRESITPVEISAELLKSLYRNAASQLEEEIEGAVITVPAYFDDTMRQATKDAARIADIKLLRLINEPTSAAIAYGLDSKSTGKVMVYDLGGGTFDVTILDIHNGVFDVLATGGDTQLGGDDVDRAIAQDWIQRYGIQNSASLMIYARSAKEALSTSPSYHGEYENFVLELDRQQLNDICLPFVKSSFKICAKALKDAKIKVSDLDTVLLVGGSSRLATVRSEIERAFAAIPLSTIDPDRVVAHGAAIQAAQLSGHCPVDGLLLLDVLPLSLGIEMMGGLVEILLSRQSKVPSTAKQSFTTYQDNQTGVDFHIVQGEREFAKDCRSLAKFRLSGIPPMKAGLPKVTVSFQVDADGLLSVDAKEELSGQSCHLDVKPSYGMTAEQVNAIIQNSIEHLDDDTVARNRQERVNELQFLLDSIEPILRDGVSYFDSKRLLVLQKEIANAQNALNDATIPLTAVIDRIKPLADELANARLSDSFKRALAGKSVDEVVKDA